jgi:predicted GNAT superfamily acetyltransferase
MAGSLAMDAIIIRECIAVDELDSCIRLQREVFGLPDLEVSPRRHFIVSRQAGGWTLGAFAPDDGSELLVGFVHHLAAVGRGNEIFGYSHMMAVALEYQNKGVGAKLKWAQRERALREGSGLIKWTWDPMQARNAHFNLNRLGVTVSSYAQNFYGTDYVTSPAQKSAEPPGIDSDRLFANWELQSSRVRNLATGSGGAITAKAVIAINIPADWTKLFNEDPAQAKLELLRVRGEFQNAFAADLVCAGFESSSEQPRYLLYEKKGL